MTTHPAATAFPIQLRLPGQAAAPEGPLDPFMMYVLHHAFRRDLADFAAAVPRTKLEDPGTWRALADRWTMFATALHHHHNGEDLELWPLLEERCDETEKRVLEAMDAEHDLIDPILEECTAGFTAMAAHPNEQSRAQLTDALVRAQPILGDHLAHEETEAVAIVQRRMTMRDWEDFEAKMAKQSGLGEMLKMSPMMVKGLSDADRAVVFARLPGILKLLIKLGGPRFRRLDGRAFYYLNR